MSEATRAQILTWVAQVLGPATGASINAGALTISRNVLDQVSIWEGYTSPQPKLVFVYEPPDRLFFRPGAWVDALAAVAAADAAREAGEGEGGDHHRYTV